MRLLTPAYLNYLWRSTNEHGVHSPYVFSWVTRGIYGKQQPPLHRVLQQLPTLQDLPEKHLKALNRSLYHVFEDGTPELFTPETAGNIPEGVPSILFLDLNNSDPEISAEALIGWIKEDTLLLIRKKGEPKLWKTLLSDPGIRLTVDCFHIGYAMKRPQQAKENFTIRL